MNAREAADHHPDCRSRHGQRCTCGLAGPPAERVVLGHIDARSCDGAIRVVRVIEQDGTAYDVTLTGPVRGQVTPAPPCPTVATDEDRIPGPDHLEYVVRIPLTDGRRLVIDLNRVNEFLRHEYEGNGNMYHLPPLPCDIDDGP